MADSIEAELELARAEIEEKGSLILLLVEELQAARGGPQTATLPSTPITAAYTVLMQPQATPGKRPMCKDCAINRERAEASEGAATREREGLLRSREISAALAAENKTLKVNLAAAVARASAFQAELKKSSALLREIESALVGKG